MDNIKLTYGRDVNGNKTIKVKSGVNRAFSIQTAGVLPKTHKGDINTLKDVNKTFAIKIEIMEYVLNYGTKTQKMILKD